MHRPKQWGHCRGVYRSLRHLALLSSFASRQMTSSDYLDNTGESPADHSEVRGVSCLPTTTTDPISKSVS
jgi:hypothetical protein